MDCDKYIFVENHDEDLSNNYVLLYTALQERNCKVRVHYLKMAHSSWPVIVKRSIDLIWDMSTAKCVLLNDSNSIFGAFTVRKETKVVQLWHACGAFKKWGHSVADKSFGDDAKDLEQYSGHTNYDLVTVSGDAVRWAYEEAFHLQERSDVVQAIGVSRTDIYFSKERQQQARVSMEQYSDFIAGRKILLYAPTFRGDIQNAKSPKCMDLKELSRLNRDYVCVIKQHPFVKEAYVIPDEYKDFCMEADPQLSIEDLLMVSDLCVTDYSSIIFEYSLLRKPMMFLTDDLDEYYDERGFYYSYQDFVPGPIVSTTKELVQYIEQLENYDMNKITDFAAQYMNSCDGQSTERIMKYILE